MRHYQVTVIGSGFAALAAITALRQKSANCRLEITMIAPKRNFLHLPSLIWIPSGMRSADEINLPLDDWRESLSIQYVQASAQTLEEGGRVVVTTDGQRIRNDGLIIASGAAYMAKAPGIEHTLNPCAGLNPTQTFARRLEKMGGGKLAFGFAGNPNEPTAVRGGPMFEFLFGTHTLLRRQKRLKDFELTFFSPMPKPGQRLGEKAVTGLLAGMDQRGIRKHLGHKIKGFTPNCVKTEGGEVEADMILFTPGACGQAWFKNTGLPLSAGGFIIGDAGCRVEGVERVYVAGDAGSLPGPDWRAKQGYQAGLQAEAAAVNLLAELKGHEPTAQFKNELICIVDTLESGSLVRRTPGRTWMAPGGRPLHWLKRFLEWRNLQPYRF
ncbi:NAD(P)/FAD-dependent oxidoreductase [Magnetofaba australis]|uniref:Putative FAD-dependent pyridine nucleotide-disulfide oxidoreductase n=1 Tax=Magnetofaba australis IT-1 TaxID=1434232 RepID=A0A1Y2K1H0_9PROT|nr:FAD-dependent oxidoreductase [Magnetofaba australis]OSM01527.1 putative FAD-dependent pyridine nucleotide-disulfide oxidoreductase [Magnetofaba australis IT-1]